MDAAFVRKHQIGPNIWEFFVAASSRLDYQPGQYVHVQLDVVDDYRGQQRAFTLTSLPDNDHLSFAVKFPNHHSAYKHTLQHMQAGDRLSISQAMGDLVLPRDTSRPLVFVAGGLGVASFVSMMKALVYEPQPRNIRLLYAHKPDESLYAEAIANCPGLQVRHIVSPSRINTTDIVASQSNNTLYYISGGESFTLDFRDALLHAHNINPTNIVYDYFDGYQPSEV